MSKRVMLLTLGAVMASLAWTTDGFCGKETVVVFESEAGLFFGAREKEHERLVTPHGH